MLEMAAKFAAARQRVVMHNIANIDTPDFLPNDLSPTDFQRAMKDAVERRRARMGGAGGDAGELEFRGTRQFRVDRDGRVRVTPTRPSGNILFHDRNNRDLERLMQANTENVAAFRIATELLRTRYELLRAAIAERV